jgi:hypothetical protein
MPNRKLLRPTRRRAGASPLAATAVIGFSFTLVGAGLAMLFGFVPQRMLPALDGIDATILLLFVPLCALTFAILAEAIRATLTGSFRHAPARGHASSLEPWRPGHGEG